MANRNAVRSVRMITDAFAQLLRCQSFPSITVTAVMHQANLARNTFYAHFSSTDDLLRVFISSVVDRTRANLRQLSPYADPRNPRMYLMLLMNKVQADSQLLLERIFVPNDANRKVLTSVVRSNAVPVLYPRVKEATGCSDDALQRYVDFVSELTMTVIYDYLTQRLEADESATAGRLTQIYQAACGLYLTSYAGGMHSDMHADAGSARPVESAAKPAGGAMPVDGAGAMPHAAVPDPAAWPQVKVHKGHVELG